MKKRAVAFLLSVMLLISLLPTAAFATYAGNANPIIDSATIVWKDNKNQIKLVMSTNYVNGQELHVGVITKGMLDAGVADAAPISNIQTSITDAQGVYVNIPANAANVQGGTVYADLPQLPLKDDTSGRLTDGQVIVLVWSAGTGTGNWNLSSAGDAVTITDGKGEVTKEDPTAALYTIGAAGTYNAGDQKPVITAGTGAGTVDKIFLADNEAGTQNKTETGKTNAGTYHVFVDVAASTLYNAKTDLYLGTWEIKKAPLAGTVALTRLCTEGDPFGAGETVTATFTAGTPAAVNADLVYNWTVNGVANANTGASYTTTGAEKKIEVSVTAAATSTNFTNPTTAIKAEITGGIPKATATIADLEYNGAVQTPTITYGDAAHAAKMSVSYSPAEIKNAGAYTATFTSNDEELAAPDPVTFKVTKVNLTLAVKGAEVTGVSASGWTLDDVATGTVKGSDKLADVFGALTVDGADPAVYKDGKNLVTVTFYEKVAGAVTPATECTSVNCTGTCTCRNETEADRVACAEAGHNCTYVAATTAPDTYEKITAAPEAGKTYYVDIAVAADTTNLTNYNSQLKNTAGAPADGTLAQFTKITFATPAPPSFGGGGGGTTVSYVAGAHGTLTGKTSESVTNGATPKNVPTPVADAGWAFVGWSADGGKTLVNPANVKVTASVTYTAYFGHAPYMVGRADGLFKPFGALTRAEAVTMLARLTDGFSEDGNYAGNNFTDVELNDWFADYVGFGVSHNFVKGYDDGTYKPNQAVTRGEFATMVARYLGLQDVSGAAFPDCADHWAAGAVNALAQAGIVNGYEDGTFRPDRTITRAEAAKMVNLAVKRAPQSKDITKYGNPYSDVPTTEWFFYDVMEASIPHIVEDLH